MSLTVLLLLSLGAAVGLFSLAFLLARRLDNYGIVDVVWAYAFGALAILYAWLGSGWPMRRVLFAALVVLWSVRLGSYLFRRVMGHHPVEDSRYREMRVRWAANFSWEMFKFFQWQALSVVVLGLPFLLVAQNPSVPLHPLELAGACLWFLALVGESVADGQLAAFKRNPENRGLVCNVGLWRVSRHPNYFFEWLVWVAYFIFALASPWGWVAILSPAAILYLLLRVTGIPLNEEQLLRSRGEAYRRYQRTTPAFFPWFPRRDPSP
jgi:steroid 5-alpha reductase family enzyme